MKAIIAAAAFGLALAAGPAWCDDLVEEYNAFIGQDDLYNSSNARLTQPWQIIRQDRANVHKFGISQRGDEGDGYFESAANRELLEGMVARGAIERKAGMAIVRGNVMINVRILRGRRGDYVNVTVF